MIGIRAVAGIAAMIAIGGFGVVASAKDGGCQHNRERIGACFAVRGSYQLSADRGFILTRDDTGRALIVRPAPHSRRDVPENLIRAADRAQRSTRSVSAWVRGYFFVCPVPVDQPGSDNVCIERASELTTEPPKAR